MHLFTEAEVPDLATPEVPEKISYNKLCIVLVGADLAAPWGSKAGAPLASLALLECWPVAGAVGQSCSS